MKSKCCVTTCTFNKKKLAKDHGISFYTFPNNPELKLAWLKAVGLSECDFKENSVICTKHFRSEDFYLNARGMLSLKSNAVPYEYSLEDGAAPAALRVCRVCLVVDSKMYNLSDFALGQVYEQVVGLNVTSEIKLPQCLCWECAHRLLNCARFKSKALRSHRLMVDCLFTADSLTLREINSIDRIANNLTTSLGTKVFDHDSCDILINDDDVKRESAQPVWKEAGEVSNDVEAMGIEVEIKNEVENDGSTEIFFEEFPDHFESDDDRKLSEFSENAELLAEEKTEPVKSIKERKSKKRKLKEKVEKKATVKKKEPKQILEDMEPSAIMDITKDVKRKKNHDGPDETLFTITTITYEEQIAEVERRQESANYRSAPYKCTICYRGFLNRDRYDAHLVRHDEASGAFECLVCKTRLKTARALRKHLTGQHTEKFSCRGCPFTTRNRGVAREHQKWHSGTKYQCPHCASEFDKITTYLGHIRIKHVSDFVCEMCGFTFVSQKGIYVHKRKKHRTEQKPVPADGPYCSVCDVRFMTEEAHTRHLKLSARHSSDTDPNRIRNDSQSVNVEKNGRVHRKIERRSSIHPGPREPPMQESGPVTCEQCGIQLADLRLYAQHFRRVHPDKNRTKYPAMKTPAMCELCGRIFQSMALLKDHMWVHTGEKRFKCDRCDKSFTQKTNLVFHQRVHSNVRPSYECHLCGKTFAFHNNRRRHMFIHTGLKPFKCTTCGKCFTTQGEQRAHLEHVHLKKPWPKRARPSASGGPSVGQLGQCKDPMQYED